MHEGKAEQVVAPRPALCGPETLATGVVAFDVDVRFADAGRIEGRDGVFDQRASNPLAAKLAVAASRPNSGLVSTPISVVTGVVTVDRLIVPVESSRLE